MVAALVLLENALALGAVTTADKALSGSPSTERRLLACNGNVTRPMLWTATKGGGTFYLLGTYDLKAEDMNGAAAPPAVLQALSCTDMGYFQLPCAATSTGGMGQYFEHCRYYPFSVEKNSIAKRLSATDLAALQVAFSNMVDAAAPECGSAVAHVKASIPRLNSTDFRDALFPYYEVVAKLLDASHCAAGLGETYEDWVRSAFDRSNQPSFGLQDVASICEAIRGNSVEEDVELARYIIQSYGDPAKVQNALATKAMLAEVVKCGDLGSVAAMQNSFNALPWLSARMVADRNAAMVNGIQRALAMHTNRTILFSVGAVHLAGTGASKSIPALLVEEGFTVERLAANARLQCSPSTHTGPSAAKLGRCLAPPFETQPPSCLSFTAAFTQRLGNDTLRGRVRNDNECVDCSNSLSSCACEVDWGNQSAFEAMCAQPVNGVAGRVLDVDLTRNPGSSFTGVDQSEKTIRAMSQDCYATTCNVKLLEEMALRSWYSNYGDLAKGKATLRPATPLAERRPLLDVVGGIPIAMRGAGSQPRWTILVWQCVLVVLAVCLCVAVCLLAGTLWSSIRLGSERSSRSARVAAEDEDGEEEDDDEESCCQNDAPQQSLGTAPIALRQPWQPTPSMGATALQQQPWQQLGAQPSRPSSSSAFHIPGPVPFMEKQALQWQPRQEHLFRSICRSPRRYGLVPPQLR